MSEENQNSEVVTAEILYSPEPQGPEIPTRSTARFVRLDLIIGTAALLFLAAIAIPLLNIGRNLSLIHI